MKGYYYLHTNGDLIYRTAFVVDADPSYFDSRFVKKCWPLNTKERESAWIICIEALALGAKKERVFELKEKWNLTDDDAQEFADRVNLKISKDGNQWCATFSDFIDLQTSQAGFGDTALEAFTDLAKQGLTDKPLETPSETHNLKE